ncbi:MAG TPA: hypothetical protein VMT57_05200 [Candidatus Thermoplasmatota archaeon]|nr:hypothetical protein [Candidatus Thermoplasmatota archaeon]
MITTATLPALGSIVKIQLKTPGDLVRQTTLRGDLLQSSSWPMFHHDLQHTGYSDATAPETNSLLWTSSAGY